MASATRLQTICPRCAGSGEEIEDDTGDLILCPDCEGAGWVTVEEPPAVDEQPDIQTIEGYIWRQVAPIFQHATTGDTYAYLYGSLFALMHEDLLNAALKVVRSAVEFDRLMLRNPHPESVQAKTALVAFRHALDQYDAVVKEKRTVPYEPPETT